jgi:hypothetical protein
MELNVVVTSIKGRGGGHGNSGVGKRIILKYSLQKQATSMWTGFIWHKIN